MNFKKTFDYTNIDNFLPDNITLARADFFESKFNHKLPAGYGAIFEAKSRIEYSEEDEKLIIEQVKQKEIEYMQKLMKEYEERQLEGLENKVDEMQLEIKPITDNNIKISTDNNINE